MGTDRKGNYKQNKAKATKTKQSKTTNTLSPFHSVFDYVRDVQIRSSAIIGGGNGKKEI